MCECGLNNVINMETYKKIIHIMYEEHNAHLNKWINGETNVYNLKKTCVCDVYSSCNDDILIKENFKQYMDKYIDTLNDLYLKIVERIYSECNIFVIGRIKGQESITLKLYKKSNEKDGKFPILKCLNDLLGFRIIDSQYTKNKDNLVKYLDDVISASKCRIKHLDRVNGDYKAFHIYFQGIDNKSFPLELQVWDLNDEKINLQSHEIYKKEYTSWPNKYKNLLERSE